jgi:DedD protein
VNDILKQRLVGALILVALGVVFWPIIFVEPGDQAVAEQGRIPPRPEVATTAIEAPDLAGLRASPELTVPREAEEIESPSPRRTGLAGVLTPAATVTAEPPDQARVEPAEKTQPERASATRSEPPEKLVIDGDGVPVAWILQVVTVSSADKADELRQRLLKLNHKAYVKKVQRGNKTLYRVYIGPKFERAQLAGMQADIDAAFGVKSMIARYLP